MQVENEYGSYAKDPNYMAYVKRVMLAHLLVSVVSPTQTTFLAVLSSE